MGRAMNSPSADSVIDRIVEQNDALWKFMHSDGRPREERMALLKKAFPNSPALNDESAADTTPKES
jgi:hypothetical protein